MMNKIVSTLLLVVCIGVQSFSQSAQKLEVFPYAYTPDQSEENLKYGLISIDHEIVLEPMYKMIEPFQNPKYNDFTLFEQEGKRGKTVKGIISKDGIPVKGLEGKGISYDGNGKFAVLEKKKNLKVIDILTNNVIVDTDTASLIEIVKADKYFLVMQNRKDDYFFFMNAEGQRLSSDRYEFKLFHIGNMEGVPIFKTQFNYKNSKYIDPYGKAYNQYDLKKADSVLPSRNNRKINSINKTNKQTIIKTVEKSTIGYRVDEYFHGKKSFVSVKRRMKYALANEKGDLVTDCVFDEFKPLATDFYNKGKYDTENYILCRKGDHFGLISTDGEMILDPIFDMIDFDYEHKLIYVSIGNYSGYCSMKGNVFLPKDCNCY